MKTLINLTVLAALLIPSAVSFAAEGDSYRLRIATKGVKKNGAASPPPQSSGIPVAIWWLSPRGCYHNDGFSYTPLWAAGDDATLCNQNVGKFALNQSMFELSSSIGVLLNTPHPQGTPQRITSSLVNEIGRCMLTHDDGSGSGVTYLASSADKAMCANNQAVGKYLAILSHEQPTTAAVTDLVNPVPGLQVQITSSVPGPGCMVAWGPTEDRYQYVPNYFDGGVNLCEGSSALYRASSESLHANP